MSSLLDQSYPVERYQIIVVDDNSLDSTASIVSRLSEKYDNLTLMDAGNLPDGWGGKSNACRKGAEKAEGEWLCFIDADVCAESELLEASVNFAISEKVDLLTINPFQEIVSLSERLFLPGIFLSIAYSMDFTHVNEPSSKDAVANGQFMLFRRTAYESIGGHSAVRSEVMEDLAFARVVKESGYRLYWLFGEDLAKTRMYSSFLHIWEGFSKNLSEIMRNKGTFGSICSAMISLLLAWAPILVLLLTYNSMDSGEYLPTAVWAFGLSLVGAVAMFIMYTITLKALRIPPGYVFCIPLGFTLHAVLIISSLWKRKKGKRRWKGRTYN